MRLSEKLQENISNETKSVRGYKKLVNETKNISD